MSSYLVQPTQKKNQKQSKQKIEKSAIRQVSCENTGRHINQENKSQRNQTARQKQQNHHLKLKKQTVQKQELKWKQERQRKYHQFQHTQRQQKQQQRRNTPTVIVIDDDDEQDQVSPPRVQEDSKQQEPKMAVVDHLESDDYFEVLGLTRQANDVEIKKAYRKLAVQWHPDKNRSHPKAEEYFKKIAEAYEVLSDVDKRQMYEKYGKRGLEEKIHEQDGTYHDHFGFGGHAGFSSRHARDIFEAFFGGKDPFEEFFHTSTGRRGRERGRGGHEEEEEDDFFGGHGMGFGGMGGMRSMMDSFFGGGHGMGMGGMGGFSSFSSSMGTGGMMGGFSSSSVSSSTYTDRNGHVVTKKTTTSTDETGQTKTIVEEFKNGKLVNSSTSSSTSRLADAGRMQLENGTSTKSTTGSRKSSSSSSSSSSSRLY